jgi:hypothetical protein
MPRIAVAVGALALAAFSIGFNTVRYTAVWNMVGGSPQFSQPSQPSESAAAAQPTAVSQSAAAGQSATPRNSAATEPSPHGWAANTTHQGSSSEGDSGDDAAVDAEEEPTRYEHPSGCAAWQPKGAEPSVGYSAGTNQGQQPTPSAPGTELAGAAPPDFREDAAGRGDPGQQVRRLPPVDRVAPFTAGRQSGGPPRSPAAIYPNSGS